MAYAFVGSAVSSTNVNAITYSPTAGNLLVLYAVTSSGGGQPNITAVTDGQSGVWSGVLAALGAGATQYFNNGGFLVQAVYCAQAKAAVTSIAITINGGNPGQISLLILEYSGLSTSSPLVGFASHTQVNPGTAANAITCGPVTVGTAPALFLNIISNVSGLNNLAVGTGFTSRTNIGLTNVRALAEDQRLTATGTPTATATTTAATNTVGSLAMAFAEPPSGTPTGGAAVSGSTAVADPSGTTGAAGGPAVSGSLVVATLGGAAPIGGAGLSGSTAVATLGAGGQISAASLSGSLAAATLSGAGALSVAALSGSLAAASLTSASTSQIGGVALTGSLAAAILTGAVQPVTPPLPSAGGLLPGDLGTGMGPYKRPEQVFGEQDPVSPRVSSRPILTLPKNRKTEMAPVLDDHTALLLLLALEETVRH